MITREQFRSMIGQVRGNGSTPDEPLLSVYDAFAARVRELEQRQAWIDTVGPPDHPDDERQWVLAYLSAQEQVTTLTTVSQQYVDELAAARAKVHELEQRLKIFACEKCFCNMMISCAENDPFAIPCGSAGKQEWCKCGYIEAQFTVLTQAHQQLVKDRDMQASTIRSMRVTIDGLNVLVDSLNSGNERRKAQLQQAVEALETIKDHLYLEIHAGHMPGRLTWLMEQAEAVLATHKEKG